MDNQLPRIDFNKIYNRYLYLLKSTFHSESTTYTKLKASDKSCFGTNLKKTDYQNYKRNKSNLKVVRCRNKTKGEGEMFCPTHKELCSYLNDMTHQAEKLFDGELTDLYENHIFNELRSSMVLWTINELDNYIDYLVNSELPRINLYILFFALQYELFIRKERSFLCYYYLQDEGHAKAIQMREKVLELLAKRLNIIEYIDTSPADVCKYLKNLSYRYNELSILSLDIAVNYLDLLDIKTSNQYLFSDFFDMFKKLPYHHKEPINNSKVSSVRALIDRIISENPQYSYLFKPTIEKSYTMEESKEDKAAGKEEADEDKTDNTEGEEDNTEGEESNSDYEQEIEEIELELKPVSAGSVSKAGKTKRKKAPKTSYELLDKTMKAYSAIFVRVINKTKECFRKLSELAINRKRVYQIAIDENEVFRGFYNDVIKEYKAIDIINKIGYVKHLNQSKLEIITGKSGDEQSVKSEILKFLLIEDMCIKADYLGTLEESETWHTNKDKFLDDILTEDTNKVKSVNYIMMFFISISNLYYDYNYFIKETDKKLYHTFAINNPYNRTKYILAKLNLINSEIMIEVANLLKLCQTYVKYYEKVKEVVARFLM